MGNFYSKPGFVTAEVDSSTKSVIVYWENLSDGYIVKECCLAQLNQVIQGNAQVVIVETSTAKGVPPQDVQDWFGSTLFPKFRENNLKAIVTVLPKSALTKLASKRWMSTGKPFTFEMFECASLDDAKDIAKKYL